MSIQKQDIESKVSHKEILYHFLKSYYYGKPFREGIFVHVPEISGEQKTPSFNIYYSSKSQAFRWKDWTGNDGSAFDLVMRLYNVNFSECLEIINREMFLNIESDYNRDLRLNQTPKRDVPEVIERNFNYDVDYMNWNKKLLFFWEQYGIKKEHLDFYGVNALRSVFAYSKSNNPYTIEATEYEPIYAYIEEGWAKIYRPYSQPMKFLYVGDKPDYFVFGYDQLPEKGKNLYLVGGEKDVITMYAHGMSAVCLNSEESSPINYPKLLELIKSNKFENFIIMYDNDTTGKRQMDKIIDEFPIFKKKLVPEMENGNDISDYYKNYYANRIKKD